MHRVAAPVALFFLLASDVGAQETGPRTGGWGAENRTDFGGALLRFRSPNSAWLLGAAFSYHYAANDPSGSQGRDRTTVIARLGMRRYSRMDQKTRPYRSFSLVVQYADFFTGTMRPGAAAEWGVAHFFLPNLSAGVSGELVVMGSHEEGFSSSSFLGRGTSRSVVDVQFSGFRVNAAVFF